MKRLLAMLIALMLFALPAFAEPMSPLDYTDDLTQAGCPVYYFQELSLQLPAEWAGKVMAMPGDGGVDFYQIASYDQYREEGIDGGGFLFRLGASVNHSFSELPSFEYLGFSEDSAMNYYLEFPTDYPAYNDADIRAEYDAMLAQIDYVAAHAQFYAGNVADDAVEDIIDDAGPNDMAEAPADSAAEGEAAWTPAEVRNQFEHSMLPRYFYDSPEAMLNGLQEVGLYWLWESIATENGADPFYPAGDYVEHWYTTGDGATLLQIELPRPDANLLCFRIYFVYDPATGSAGYYTAEYDNLLGDSAMLCGWTQDRTHVNYGGTFLPEEVQDYGAALLTEAEQVATLAGFSAELIPADASVAEPAPELVDPASADLSVIPCPQLGFTTMADPAYSWAYEEGTGVYIYTQTEGSIPYVIVYKGEDLIAEPLEYIREQVTPHFQQQYGDDLVAYVEYETYDIGGKQLPAGLYTYRLQGYLIDMLRLYDSTGSQTVSYTAKYVSGEGDATLAALDTAIRGFRTE